MAVQIIALTAEHHHNGFAIFSVRPRLSWRFASSAVRDWVQTSYTLRVIRSSGEGSSQQEEHHVDSSNSLLVPWPSSPLSSREVVDVQVQAHGRDGSQTNWASLKVEAALLERSDWKASLISGPPQSVAEPKRPFRLRKGFRCPSVQGARLYASAHGIYQIEINGKVVGDELLAPGWQSYKHRLHYQTYDITAYLECGENVVGAYVAEGWFAGRLGRPGVSNIWGDRLGILAQVEVAGEVVCVSDQSWEYLDGPILGAEIYNGEVYDSTLEQPTWSSTSSTAQAQGRAYELPFPLAQLIAPEVAPVRRVMEVEAQEIIRTPTGKLILDFGQNLVGWLRIQDDIPGKAGDELVIRHAEVMEHGELGTRPLRTAKAENTVKLGGKTKGYEPRFSWFGFRYVLVSRNALHY
jgi:alpha-L-rhamnosidase